MTFEQSPYGRELYAIELGSYTEHRIYCERRLFCVRAYGDHFEKQSSRSCGC